MSHVLQTLDNFKDLQKAGETVAGYKQKRIEDLRKAPNTEHKIENCNSLLYVDEDLNGTVTMHISDPEYPGNTIYINFLQ